MIDKNLWLTGFLYILPGIFLPVLAILKSDTPLTGRNIVIMVISGVLGGCASLVTFLSTNYADSPGRMERLAAKQAAQRSLSP